MLKRKSIMKKKSVEGKCGKSASVGASRREIKLRLD